MGNFVFVGFPTVPLESNIVIVPGTALDQPTIDVTWNDNNHIH